VDMLLNGVSQNLIHVLRAFFFHIQTEFYFQGHSPSLSPNPNPCLSAVSLHVELFETGKGATEQQVCGVLCHQCQDEMDQIHLCTEHGRTAAAL